MTGTKPQLYVCVLVNLLALALTLLAVHVLVSVWLVSLIKDKRRGTGRQRQANITLPRTGRPAVCLCWAYGMFLVCLKDFCM